MGETLRTAVIVFFRVLDGLILLRFIFSLVFVSKENALKRFIHTVTEPILSPVRKMVAHSAYGKDMTFDISPFLAFLLLGFIELIVLQLMTMLL